MSERYDAIGVGYRSRRQPDPHIAAAIDRAIGNAQSVLNVGAGSGSYEPTRPRVTAVEPSPVMIRQRAADAAPVLRARAEQLPFRDAAFDVGLAVLTVHHWADPRRGLSELVRVSRRQVIFTFDPDKQRELWFTRDYVNSCAEFEEKRGLKLDAITRLLGSVQVQAIPVPHDCVDGFLGAYWRRPEMYLDASVRASISTLAQLPPHEIDPGLARLAADLEDGAWHTHYADLLNLGELDLGYRLIVTD